MGEKPKYKINAIMVFMFLLPHNYIIPVIVFLFILAYKMLLPQPVLNIYICRIRTSDVLPVSMKEKPDVLNPPSLIVTVLFINMTPGTLSFFFLVELSWSLNNDMFSAMRNMS